MHTRAHVKTETQNIEYRVMCMVSLLAATPSHNVTVSPGDMRMRSVRCWVCKTPRGSKSDQQTTNTRHTSHDRKRLPNPRPPERAVGASRSSAGRWIHTAAVRRKCGCVVLLDHREELRGNGRIPFVTTEVVVLSGVGVQIVEAARAAAAAPRCAAPDRRGARARSVGVLGARPPCEWDAPHQQLPQGPVLARPEIGHHRVDGCLLVPFGLAERILVRRVGARAQRNVVAGWGCG